MSKKERVWVEYRYSYLKMATKKEKKKEIQFGERRLRFPCLYGKEKIRPTRDPEILR